MVLLSTRAYCRSGISPSSDLRQLRAYLEKQIEQLPSIHGHNWEHFVADPREHDHAGCSCRLLAGGGNNFTQRFGHMKLDMPAFLITPRGDLPRGLIKLLCILPGLRVQEQMTHNGSLFSGRL